MYNTVTDEALGSETATEISGDDEENYDNVNWEGKMLLLNDRIKDTMWFI